MLKRWFSIRAGTGYRHVSSNTPYRICGAVLAAFLSTAIALGESVEEGMVAELVADAELLQQARADSPSFGLLPKGTLLRLQGERSGDFFRVEVELETALAEGWVHRNRLNLEEQEKEEQKEKKKPTQKPVAVPPREESKRRVPKDERLLLKRDPTFFYGLATGGFYNMVKAGDGTGFSGLGFSLGGQLGTYASPKIPVRLELGYHYFDCTDDQANPASFGFIDIAGSGAYQIEDFEMFLRFSYSVAVSVSSLPGTLNDSFDSVNDLSSPWIGIGVGYRFQLTPLSWVSARLLYNLSFLQTPFNYQTIGVQLLLDLQG